MATANNSLLWNDPEAQLSVAVSHRHLEDTLTPWPLFLLTIA